MCAKVGVDPLASNKGFWAELLGIGDFYYELGIKLIHFAYFLVIGWTLLSIMCLLIAMAVLILPQLCSTPLELGLALVLGLMFHCLCHTFQIERMCFALLLLIRNQSPSRQECKLLTFAWQLDRSMGV